MNSAAHTLPELLAPAGTLEAGLVALDAGADAVYAGLRKFNARERARNLSIEEFGKLKRYAANKGKKIYAALNTLVREDEIPEITDILAELSLVRPDAIIVQDLGLASLIRNAFPCLAMHASTQMGFHNSAGLAVAKKLGFSRVILERQTTFEEIAAMRLKEPGVELEIFVHGALCCGRSGACLLSSWMGGWSGNRGKCKQPCRRRYFSEAGNGFFLSPGDLCAIEHIPRIKELGVSGLKIEGRLKPSDYVRAVVAAYRLVLDAPGHEHAPAVRQAKAMLRAVPGRKFVGPFISEADFKNAVKYREMGASGTPLGRVVGVEPGGFEAELNRALCLRERIRLQPENGEEGPAFSVSRMLVNGRPARKAGPGAKCVIFADVPAAAGALIFKTGSNIGGMTSTIRALPAARTVLDIDVELAQGTVRIATATGGKWAAPLAMDTARNRPLKAANLVAVFKQTNSEKFAAGRINVRIQENCFVPVSALNAARRAFWAWAETSETPAAIKQTFEAAASAFLARAAAVVLPQIPRATTVGLKKNDSNPVPDSLVARPLDEADPDADEAILPDFCPETQLKPLMSRLRAQAAGRARRFRATSLYALELLSEFGDAVVVASFPIPACNSLAVLELFNLHAAYVTAWPELDKRSIAALTERFGPGIEVFCLGRPALLNTRMEIPRAGRITDGRGAGFIVERDGPLFRVYSEKVFSIPEPGGASVFMDLSRAALNDGPRDSFNYERQFV